MDKEPALLLTLQINKPMKLQAFTKLLGVTLSLLCILSCGTKHNYDYEVHSLGVGGQGSYLIKVYSYASNQKKAIERAKRDGVDAVLFKGIPAGPGVSAQKPLVSPQDHAKNEKFFKEFYKSGRYLQFVALSNDGTIRPQDRLKVGSQYKIGVALSIQKDALRKYLESEGIIKKLGSIF